MEQLYVRLLGEFSLQIGEVQISEKNDRSKKVWLLLAYFLTHRNQAISRRTLIDLLWGDDSAGNNPENSLKAVMYRVRNLLNQLWSGAGHELILYKKDTYTWNTEIPMQIDVEEFESLCKQSYGTEEERSAGLIQAQSLYRGDFLESFSSEPWAISLVPYYHNLYIQTVLDVIPLLVKNGRHNEVVSVCKAAMVEESYHEPLHQHLMQALIAQGDYKETTEVYEKLSQQLFDEFGLRPSEETVALYRTALQTLRNEHLSMDDVLDYLQESNIEGALECDYDYFKIISRAEARTVRRTGISAHIALLTVSGLGEKELTRKSLNLAMEHLGEQIRITLRQSDAYSRCSIAQYALLLPNTTYENGCAVSKRIITAYIRRYPQSPVKIEYHVNALV